MQKNMENFSDENETINCLRCDPRSFGEAYHVCAAAILDENVKWCVVEVKSQEKDRAKAAEEFLKAHAENRKTECEQYKQCNNKSTTLATRIVAKAFEECSNNAVAKLREKWLPSNVQPSGETFAEKWLTDISRKKVLIWNRARDYQSERNTSLCLLNQLFSLVAEANLFPILFGHPIEAPRSPCNLTELWREPELESHMAQLSFVNLLRDKYNLVGSIGNRSGGMDGHALLGLPTLYLEASTALGCNQERMKQWVDVVPGYKRLCLNKPDIDDACLADEVKKWLTEICDI